MWKKDLMEGMEVRYWTGDNDSVIVTVVKVFPKHVDLRRGDVSRDCEWYRAEILPTGLVRNVSRYNPVMERSIERKRGTENDFDTFKNGPLSRRPDPPARP